MDRESSAAAWQAIDWPAIREWAGATVARRGWDYQHRGRVRDLARAATGAIVAWVQGSARYATGVDIDEQGLVSACTCPYGGGCKHAVAVALDYLNAVQQGRELPTVPATDPRLELLDNQAAAWAGEEDGDREGIALGAATPAALRAFLDGQSQAALVNAMNRAMRSPFPQRCC
jgi:uncharacterized Zn finger protein